MKGDVTVNFGHGRIIALQAQCDNSHPQAAAIAHKWLDDAYVRFDCEPVRLSGKVLLLDRILAIAMAAGYEGLHGDPELAREFACNTVLSVGHARITIDVPGLTVGY